MIDIEILGLDLSAILSFSEDRILGRGDVLLVLAILGQKEKIEA